MRVDISRNALLLITLLILIQLPTPAQDWTRWRGPTGDGAAVGFSAPRAWPDQLKRKWKMNVGIGHSSPIVVGKRVYVHARQGENEIVAAYDADSGRKVWEESYSAAYQVNPAAAGHGKGPKSTPVFYNDKIYTLGITGILSCFDANNGKLKWRKEGVAIFSGRAPLYGTATSPIVDGGKVIAFLGENDRGGLIAFDAETGLERWRWAGDGPGYATPIVVTIAGKRQIVTQSQQNIVGIWADNGGLLWKVPFDTEYVQNIVTPIAYKDLLIFSGINKGVFALRVGWRDNKWVTDTVWQNKDVSMYMNSPILSGNLLFGFSHKNKGQFFSLDADTGKTLWTGDGRQGENAAMVIASNLIFSLTNDGTLIVSSATDKASTPIKKYTLAQSETWAHPILSGKRIFIKDEQTLAMWMVE